MTDDQIRKIAIAIYTVNRHAKTATDNKNLYQLKKLSLEKLIRAGKAQKSACTSRKTQDIVNSTQQHLFNVKISSSTQFRKKKTLKHFLI